MRINSFSAGSFSAQIILLQMNRRYTLYSAVIIEQTTLNVLVQSKITYFPEINKFLLGMIKQPRLCVRLCNKNLQSAYGQHTYPRGPSPGFNIASGHITQSVFPFNLSKEVLKLGLHNSIDRSLGCQHIAVKM